MGDRLWTGKPPRRRTRHPGLLSLSPPSVAGWIEYPAKAEVQPHRVIHQPVSVVSQCGAGAWLNELVGGGEALAYLSVFASDDALY